MLYYNYSNHCTMLNHLNEKDILFIDIETVPGVPDLEGFSEELQRLWDKKSSYFRKEDEAAKDVFQRAGIYAEFGKVICISSGFIKDLDNRRLFRVKSVYGDDEKELLSEFAGMLAGLSGGTYKFLCAHNGKEFDYPYLARRMLINGLDLPQFLDIAGKKPWESAHLLDTLELWKFGEYKNFTSLDLLTNIFGIPTPKTDIDGSDVARVYWEEKDLKRIAEYCERDVLAVAQLFLKYKGLPLISEENVESVTVF